VIGMAFVDGDAQVLFQSAQCIASIRRPVPSTSIPIMCGFALPASGFGEAGRAITKPLPQDVATASADNAAVFFHRCLPGPRLPSRFGRVALPNRRPRWADTPLVAPCHTHANLGAPQAPQQRGRPSRTMTEGVDRVKWALHV